MRGLWCGAVLLLGACDQGGDDWTAVPGGAEGGQRVAGLLAEPAGLVLSAPVIAQAGVDATLGISGADPGETVILGWSSGLALDGAGPCPPAAGGLCLDLAAPARELGRVRADGNGEASLRVRVPAGATPGAAYHAQAVVVRGAVGVDTVASNVTKTEVGASLCQGTGTAACPLPIDGFPFVDARDTRAAPSDTVDSYACEPATDESGPEFFYRVILDEPGMLTASLVDPAGVDIDVHVLATPDPADCLDRAHELLGEWLEPGIYTVVADTWVGATGAEYPGDYTLSLHFVGASSPCAMDREDQRMYWTGCAPGIDCYTSGADTFLELPAFGPVVEEAHLVTTAESFPGGWPTSFTDGTANHYAVSEAASDFVTVRSQPWAPDGEGGSEFGQGSTGNPVPVLDEAWYVNMYWRTRPPGGTRMIVFDPVSGRAVVGSAGYETGPGANDAIGGAVEEIHLWNGTTHRDPMVMGFAADPTLPLGPIDCEG